MIATTHGSTKREADDLAASDAAYAARLNRQAQTDLDAAEDTTPDLDGEF